jgi:colanic acid biosynthesis glycosyl transferase WcaI
MKILIHTMYFLPEFGSAPILMNELAEGLAARGRTVEVITTLPRPPHNQGYQGRFYVRETSRGFRVKRILTNFTVHPIGRLIAWTIYTLWTWLNLLTVKRGDVVFLRLPPLQLGVTGVLARRFRGARVILNVQDIHPDLSIESGLLRNPFLIRLAQAFEKWIYRQTSEILVISEGFKKNILAKGVPAGKIAVLPNWVDTDVLSPRPRDNPVSRRFGLNGKFVLMYSGTISISSSATLERILDAAALLRDDPDILVALVGEGLKKPDLTLKAAELHLPNVVFIPFQPYQDLPDLLGSADVLLVPLDKEKSLLSVPSKLYTFMSAGRPILGLAHSDSEVFSLIGETGCGTCAPPDDPQAIAAAIRALKADAAGRQGMGRAGRAYAEAHFSRRAVLDAFDRLLSGPRPPARRPR